MVQTRIQEVRDLLPHHVDVDLGRLKYKKPLESSPPEASFSRAPTIYHQTSDPVLYHPPALSVLLGPQNPYFPSIADTFQSTRTSSFFQDGPAESNSSKCAVDLITQQQSLDEIEGMARRASAIKNIHPLQPAAKTTGPYSSSSLSSTSSSGQVRDL